MIRCFYVGASGGKRIDPGGAWTEQSLNLENNSVVANGGRKESFLLLLLILIASVFPQCWETFVGQELYRLVVMDFIFILFDTFVGEFIWR